MTRKGLCSTINVQNQKIFQWKSTQLAFFPNENGIDWYELTCKSQMQLGLSNYSLPSYLSCYSPDLSPSQTKAVYRGILMTMENSTTLRKHMFCDRQLNRHQTNKHSVLNKVSHKNTGSFNFLICCFSCLWHFSWRCCYNVSLDLDNYLPCQLRTISHLAHLDLLHMSLKLRELGIKFKIHTCVVQFL